MGGGYNETDASIGMIKLQKVAKSSLYDPTKDYITKYFFDRCKDIKNLPLSKDKYYKIIDIMNEYKNSSKLLALKEPSNNNIQTNSRIENWTSWLLNSFGWWDE